MQATNIHEATHPDQALTDALNRLLPQLAPDTKTLSLNDVKAITESGGSHLYIMETGGETIGTYTLCIYDSPTGRKVWLEDVIVDSQYRGKGLGSRLVAHAMNEAKRFAPCTLMLTSRPSRIAANALYQASGMERKETNVYKKVLSYCHPAKHWFDMEK